MSLIKRISPLKARLRHATRAKHIDVREILLLLLLFLLLLSLHFITARLNIQLNFIHTVKTVTHLTQVEIHIHN